MERANIGLLQSIHGLQWFTLNFSSFWQGSRVSVMVLLKQTTPITWSNSYAIVRLEKAAKKSLAADLRLYSYCAPLKYLIIWISDVLKEQ